MKVGNGTSAPTSCIDEKNGGRPLEVGVAMSEQSLEGLPAPRRRATARRRITATTTMNMYLLDLPAQNPTPYKFVQFDWNPAGHEPAGRVRPAALRLPLLHGARRRARTRSCRPIRSTQQKAASYPGAASIRAPFYLDAATAAGGVPAAAVTVPMMGLHWLDVRSPELQMLTGNPGGYQPFTKTFIYGSWDGQFIFDEPMITRAYILAKKTATDPAVVDEIIPVSTAQRYSPAGYYPSAYRITWDAQAKEYRIALTQLSWRD